MILSYWRGIQVGILIIAIAVLGSGCNMSDLSGQVWKAIDDDDIATIESLSKSNKSVLSKVGLDGSTPLLYAMRKGRKECFETLLKCGANPNQTVGRFGKSAITFAASHPDAFYLKTTLLYGADPNLDNKASPSRRGTPLLYAISDERTENVQILLKAGADPDLSVGEKARPIVRASNSDLFEVVLALIDAGADIHLRESGFDCFAYAMHKKKPETFTDPPTRDACQKVWDKLKEMGVDPEKAHWEGEYFVW